MPVDLLPAARLLKIAQPSGVSQLQNGLLGVLRP
jgi:hypothetical protein